VRLRQRREVAEATPAVAAAPTHMDHVWDGAFAVLSRQQRAVIALHYYHGYTLDECAGLMGCGPGSARQHLARALRRLRETIDAG
jgi:RNA polymerase sigma factor (sigma-70 family)